MEPTPFADDDAGGRIRFGRRRRKGLPVLRLRATKTKSTIFFATFAGLAVVAGLHDRLGHPFAFIAVVGLFAVVGAIVGSKRRADTCVQCESALAVEIDRCVRCDAPIGGEITRLRDRAAAEEKMRQERVAARKLAEAERRLANDDDDDDDDDPPSST
ncbi:MAG: hypothetical protein KF819_12115 [Labilithrix sp.]|nr:hypothetical protein [Labilithrix sp.]